MKRQLSKADLVARLDSVDRERTLLHYALSATMNGERPAAVERWNEGDDHYTVSLYHPTAPHGGFVITTFHYPGQSDSHSVHYVDEWSRASRHHGIAIGRLDLARAAERIGAAARSAQLEELTQ